MGTVAMVRDDTKGAGVEPVREETAREMLRRAGRSGGMKRSMNIWRRMAAEQGISLEVFLERREKRIAERKKKRSEKEIRWAQERAEAERLGVTVAWYRSEKFRATQRGQLIADGQLEDLVLEAKLHRAKMNYGRVAAQKIGIKYETYRALSEEEKLRRLEAADKGAPLPTAPRRKARKDPNP